MVHPVQMGKRTRMSFARIEEALAVPDLIEVQKNSYRNGRMLIRSCGRTLSRS